MSVRTTLEKNLNAALALIGIMGYAIQGLISTWPVDPPSAEWVVIMLGLGIIAFFFYREDKAYKKDPGIREATVTSATDDLMNTFAEVLVSRVVDKVILEGKPENPELETEMKNLREKLAVLEARKEELEEE